MNDKTDTIRRCYETQFGTKFWPTFDGLKKDWSWGLMRLKEFRVLFSQDDDVALLNAITGGGFTYDVQHILWEDLLLRVCKLTDPICSATIILAGRIDSSKNHTILGLIRVFR